MWDGVVWGGWIGLGLGCDWAIVCGKLQSGDDTPLMSVTAQLRHIHFRYTVLYKARKRPQMGKKHSCKDYNCHIVTRCPGRDSDVCTRQMAFEHL